MATTSIYRTIKRLGGVESYNIYSASGINQGDMLQWDTGARLATNNLLASGSIFLGYAEEAVPVASLGTASRPLITSCRVAFSCVAFFKTTSGDTYAHLDPVYQGADAQTVTKVGSTRPIGRAWLPDGTTVTGATGTNVTVYVIAAGVPATAGSAAP